MFNVFYSTHSGKAEGFALELTQKLEDLFYDVNLKNFSQLTPMDFKDQNPFIILISTYTYGSSNPDSEHIYKWLDSQPSIPFLKGKRFAIFGLGNETYASFNHQAKEYRKFFLRNQMEEMLDIYLGTDHDGNIDKDYYQWERLIVEFIQLNFKCNAQLHRH